MAKFTNGEVQQIIDDLDYAKAFFGHSEEPSVAAEYQQVRLSLQNASDLLTDLPDEVIESLDKRRSVFTKPGFF